MEPQTFRRGAFGDVKCRCASTMYSEVSDKNTENLMCVLSKRPKNNLQQHLKGQASK